MQFNAHGNLDGGVIDVREKSELEDFLVNSFRTSTTRYRNFESFCSFWNELDKNKVTRVWIVPTRLIQTILIVLYLLSLISTIAIIFNY